MSGALLLAWRYLTHHAARSVVLACGIALVVFLPLFVQGLVADFRADLGARAASTQLVCGAKGSRYDLVLSTLYFRGRTPEAIDMAEVRALAADGLARPIPILARATAQGHPVVGTDHDYYDERGLVAARGALPALLGDAALGANVAAALGLGPGDHLLSDADNLYDLTGAYPLRLNVRGVLAETGTPDDDAVFCDLRTAWVLEGLGHGHADATEVGDDRVLRRDEDGVSLNASLHTYQEITPETAAGFHFHGEEDALPVTGVLVRPTDAKARAILKGRYRLSERAQLIDPTEVVDELLGFVVRIRRFFDANSALVGLATLLFLAVIVALSVEVRRGELETLRRIGCARGTVARMLAAEWAILIAAGATLGWAAARVAASMIAL